MEQNRVETCGARVWRDSRHICVLEDSERYFGHIVKAQAWLAFDATHPRDSQNGIRYVGLFDDVAAAKEAVEKSVAGKPELRGMPAIGYREYVA